MSEVLSKLFDWLGAALIAYLTTRWTLSREDSRQRENLRKAAEAADKERHARIANEDLAQLAPLYADLMIALSELAGSRGFETLDGDRAFARARDRCAEIETRMRLLVSPDTWTKIGEAMSAASVSAGMTHEAVGSRDSGLRREAMEHREEYGRRRSALVDAMDQEVRRLKALARGEGEVETGVMVGDGGVAQESDARNHP